MRSVSPISQAIHNLRLFRMELQSAFREPLFQRGPERLCMRLAVAVANGVICITLKDNARIVPTWMLYAVGIGLCAALYFFPE